MILLKIVAIIIVINIIIYLSLLLLLLYYCFQYYYYHIFIYFLIFYLVFLYDTSGSSVCTSLVEGESMLHPKGMGLLHIRRNKQFRLDSIPFTQIRPFLYGDLSLHNIKGNLELHYLILYGLLIKISHNP